MISTRDSIERFLLRKFGRFSKDKSLLYSKRRSMLGYVKNIRFWKQKMTIKYQKLELS